MNIWMTADTHFDHKNVIDYECRPFLDQFKMTDTLIRNWNSVVAPDDLIFHLGDVFFCKSARMHEIASQLNGRKILIQGNHDDGITRTKFKKLGFDSYKYYYIDGLFLSHHPQDASAIRTAINSKSIMGNVHGHVHSQIDGLDQSIYKCVSVELTDYTPISLQDVKSHFKE